MEFNNYPVVELSYPGGIYEPLPDMPKDHWENKNRRVWTLEEKQQLMLDAFGIDGFRPAQHKVCLLEYNPAEHSHLKMPSGSTAHWWNLGKIISLGRLCFDSRTFACGASATYGDYVMFDARRQNRTKFKGGHMIVIEDRDIVMPVKDPVSFVNGAMDAE